MNKDNVVKFAPPSWGKRAVKQVTGVVVEENGEFRTVYTTSGYAASKQVVLKTAPVPEKELLDDRIGMVADLGDMLELMGTPTCITLIYRGRDREFKVTSEGTDFVVLEEVTSK
jgi:hypothetical protein